MGKTTFNHTVKPVLTTTSEQWPPLYNSQASLIPSSLSLIIQSFDNSHFWTTATFLVSQGWPLYIGLTVQSNLCARTTLGTWNSGGLKKISISEIQIQAAHCWFWPVVVDRCGCCLEVMKGLMVLWNWAVWPSKENQYAQGRFFWKHHLQRTNIRKKFNNRYWILK